MADSTQIPPDGEPPSLAHVINTAIASSHTKINRLILDRMPHAVPPQADNPSAYITGLLHIGAVYIAFESLWQNIIGVHTEIAPLPYTYPFRSNTSASSSGPSHGPSPPQVTERARHILETAYWPNMLRASRVKADVRAMTGWPAHVVDEQLRSVGTTGALGAFLAHIKEAVDQSPHLLLAYAYSLYLALLSGGSYIRTELMYLRADFWLAIPDPVRPGMVPCTTKPVIKSEKLRRHSTFEGDSGSHGLAGEDPSITFPLSFLDFDTPLGHENPRQQAKDLKAEFKRRFADAEQALNDLERREVVAESVAIFDHLEAVVGQLDRICCSSSGAAAGLTRRGKPGRHSSSAGGGGGDDDSRPAGIGSRLRDSIAVAKGRLLRTVKRSSGSAASGASSVVTATTPSAARTSVTSKNTAATGPQEFPGGSKASSLSAGGPDTSAQRHEPDAQLARDAALPGEGFRTVHYSDDHSGTETKVAWREARGGGYDGAADDDDNDDDNDDEQRSSGRDYSQVCPVSRDPTPPARQGRGTSTSSPRAGSVERYAVVSNVAVLLGASVAFAACLYLRRSDGAGTATSTAGTGSGGPAGRDW